MITYSGINKSEFVAEVVKHRKADAILQGTYGTQNGHWKGCAVACSLRSLDIIEGRGTRVEYTDHVEFEARGLWPEWLARLEDTIFEGLPHEDAMKWPERFAKAIPKGVDVTAVQWKFDAFLMRENIERVLALDITEALKTQVVAAIRGVLTVHENAITTGNWDESAGSAAAEAARSAGEAAGAAAELATAEAAAWLAWSAARSADQAAWSAARSADSAAWSAAWSAARSADSAAWSAARSAAAQKHAKELIRLLKEAK